MKSDSEKEWRTTRVKVWNGDKAKFSEFKQGLKALTTGKKVMRDLMAGVNVVVKDDDNPDKFLHYFQDEYYLALAESRSAGERFKQIGHFKAKINSARCTLYKWLFEFTDAEARDAVVKRDETTVHKLMEELATLHGPVSDTVVTHVEEALSKVKYWVPKKW